MARASLSCSPTCRTASQQDQSDDFRRVRPPQPRLAAYTHAFSEHTTDRRACSPCTRQRRTLTFGSGFRRRHRRSRGAIRAGPVDSQDRHRAFRRDARLTDHEAFGSQTTYNAEYAYELTPAWIRAWRHSAAPSARPTPPTATASAAIPISNPRSADELPARAALQAPGDRHSVDLELYANEIEDLIEFDFVHRSPSSISTAAEIRGAHSSATSTCGDTFSRCAPTSCRQRADNTSDRLAPAAPRRGKPHRQLRAGRRPAIELGLSVLASGDREDFGGASCYAGYAVASLTGPATPCPRNLAAQRTRREPARYAEYQTARKLSACRAAAPSSSSNTVGPRAITMGKRLSKIYTRTGDDGTTGLGDGSQHAERQPAGRGLRHRRRGQQRDRRRSCHTRCVAGRGPQPA